MFTDAEVDAAVAQYLSSELSVGYTASGSRTTTELRDGALELLVTTLMLRPDAWFYLVGLCCNRIIGELNAQLSSLSVVVDAAQNTSTQSNDVSSTAELSAARTALLDVSSGLSTRETGINGSIGPGVERFRRSISRFVNTELNGVISTGTPRPTGQESRKTLQSEWVVASARHTTIVALAEAVSGAVAALGTVQLPQRAARGVVSRISSRVDELQTVLSHPGSAAENRSAVLDLLAARALLTKISGFTTPRTVLMPLSTDPTTGQLTGSGDEASIQGTVSAPYVYAGGASVTLSLNGGGSTPVVVLPQTYGSAAVLYTAALTFPGPTTPARVSVRNSVYGTFNTLDLVSSWASGVVAATELSTAFSTWVDVTWDSTSQRLIFVSVDTTDGSLIEFDQATTQCVAFTDWAFGSGAVVRSAAAQVVAADVVASFAASDPGLHATVETISYGSMRGSRLDSVPYTLQDYRLDEPVLTCDGAGVLTGSQNYENLGIVPGDGALVYSPVAQPFSVLSVSGNIVTIDDTSGVVPAGPASAIFGPDHRSLVTGQRVKLVGSARENTGYYNVLAGYVGGITLDRDIPSADTALSATIFSTTIGLSASEASTVSGIGVGASTGATALGLPVSAEVPAALQQLSITTGDFLLRGVTPGDQLTLTSPGLVTTTVQVTEVAARLLTFTPAVSYEPGLWSYVVKNSRMVDYAAPKSAADVFTTAYPDVGGLDTMMARLSLGGRYSAEYQAAVQDYTDAVVAFHTALDGYNPAREPAMDHVVETFTEQGLDRALDLLLALRVTELFTMHPDGVSYKSWVTRRAADTTREVVPQTKFAAGAVAQPSFSATEVFDPLGRGRR